MPRVTRTWVRSGLTACALLGALAASMVAAHPAYAWTHEQNTWDTTGNPACGQQSSLPCLYWAQPNNTSIHIYAYQDPSLQSAGHNHYNFVPADNNANSAYNGINAFNPFINGCSQWQGSGPGQCGQIDVSMGKLDNCVAGHTNVTDYGTVQYSSSLQQYWATWNEESIVINQGTGITWTDPPTYTNQCDVPTNTGSINADQVIAHETGHVEGLGHTAPLNMLMHYFPTCNCDTPQTGSGSDVAGIQAIYPGYYPA